MHLQFAPIKFLAPLPGIDFFLFLPILIQSNLGFNLEFYFTLFYLFIYLGVFLKLDAPF